MARVGPAGGAGTAMPITALRDKIGNAKLYGSAMAFARKGLAQQVQAQPSTPTSSPNKLKAMSAFGLKPATLKAPDGSELGDLTTSRTPFLVAQDVLAVDVSIGLYKVVKFMKREESNMEVQLKGIKVLGTIAQEGLRSQRQRNKGQAHTGHFDRSHTSAISAALIKCGATTAVLAAMVAHHKDRILVLRSCWTLEHICGTTDNWTAFKSEGGKYVVTLVKQVHGGDKELMTTLNNVKSPQRGLIKPCFSYCSLT